VSSWYDRVIVPRLVTCACGTKPILRQRQKVVPRAYGEVLEIGMGSGHNIPFYDPERVSRVIGVDPCETSWRIAQQRVQASPIDVEFCAGSAEQLPMGDAQVDTVLLTFSLCTIPDPIAALREAARVLKPGGRLFFCEHGRAPDASVSRWQDRIDPLWTRLFGGCHVNRDVVEMLGTAGFSSDDVESMYLPKTPRIAGFNVWGSASVI
jgi:ubiquinone/menaquinone biosynthesis C-methylase UbiE